MSVCVVLLRRRSLEQASRDPTAALLRAWGSGSVAAAAAAAPGPRRTIFGVPVVPPSSVGAGAAPVRGSAESEAAMAAAGLDVTSVRDDPALAALMANPALMQLAAQAVSEVDEAGAPRPATNQALLQALLANPATMAAFQNSPVCVHPPSHSKHASPQRMTPMLLSLSSHSCSCVLAVSRLCSSLSCR